MMFGAVVGVVGSGWFFFKFGCKKSLMIGVILFVVGLLFFVVVLNVEVLIFFCVLLGLVVGVVFYIVLLYFFEIVLEKICGSMILMY